MLKDCADPIFGQRLEMEPLLLSGTWEMSGLLLPNSLLDVGTLVDLSKHREARIFWETGTNKYMPGGYHMANENFHFHVLSGPITIIATWFVTWLK